MRIQCQFKKKKFFQLLELEEDCTLQNKRIGTVQRKVSEKLVMEASVVIWKKLNCHKVLHMERR